MLHSRCACCGRHCGTTIPQGTESFASRSRQEWPGFDSLGSRKLKTVCASCSSVGRAPRSSQRGGRGFKSRHGAPLSQEGNPALLEPGSPPPFASVAQWIRALVSGIRGRGFESLRGHSNASQKRLSGPTRTPFARAQERGMLLGDGIRTGQVERLMSSSRITVVESRREGWLYSESSGMLFERPPWRCMLPSQERSPRTCANGADHGAGSRGATQP